MTEKKANSGRKKSYSETHVSKALSDLKIRGLKATVENVIRHMTDEQHLPTKPRPESLREMIDETQKAEEEQRILQLIEALPKSASGFIDQAIAQSRRQLIVGVAESFSELKEQSALPLQEARERLRALREDLYDTREQRDAIRNRLQAAEDKIGFLATEIQRKDLELGEAEKKTIALRAEIDAKDKVLEMLRPAEIQ